MSPAPAPALDNSRTWSEKGYLANIREALNYGHRDGEDDGDQDDGQDAAEADHHHAREVGLKHLRVNNRRPAFLRNKSRFS